MNIKSEDEKQNTPKLKGTASSRTEPMTASDVPCLLPFSQQFMKPEVRYVPSRHIIYDHIICIMLQLCHPVMLQKQIGYADGSGRGPAVLDHLLAHTQGSMRCKGQTLRAAGAVHIKVQQIHNNPGRQHACHSFHC